MIQGNTGIVVMPRPLETEAAGNLREMETGMGGMRHRTPLHGRWYSVSQIIAVLRVRRTPPVVRLIGSSRGSIKVVYGKAGGGGGGRGAAGDLYVQVAKNRFGFQVFVTVSAP